jgi:hypothetical protein
MRKIVMTIATAALPLIVLAADAIAGAGDHIGRYATVVSERAVTVQGKPMLEVVVRVDGSDTLVRCVQAVSLFTQGEGSRVLLQLQDGQPSAINVD